MGRQKKDGKKVTYYLDQNIIERMTKYADDQGQTMTTAIERILEKFLDQYEANAHKAREH